MTRSERVIEIVKEVISDEKLSPKTRELAQFIADREMSSSIMIICESIFRKLPETFIYMTKRLLGIA